MGYSKLTDEARLPKYIINSALERNKRLSLTALLFCLCTCPVPYAPVGLKFIHVARGASSFFASLTSCSPFILTPTSSSIKRKNSPCFARKVPSRSLSMVESASCFSSYQEHTAEPTMSKNWSCKGFFFFFVASHSFSGLWLGSRLLGP